MIADGSADGRAVSDKLAVANVGVSLGAVRLLGFDPFATAGQLKPREKVELNVLDDPEGVDVAGKVSLWNASVYRLGLILIGNPAFRPPFMSCAVP